MIKKVRDMIKEVTADGWFIKNQEGSHRQFIHPTKPGKVTINGHLHDDLGHDLVKSIYTQAGLKKKK